jgi:hypothetical protein
LKLVSLSSSALKRQDVAITRARTKIPQSAVSFAQCLRAAKERQEYLKESLMFEDTKASFVLLARAATIAALCRRDILAVIAIRNTRDCEKP